MILEVGSSSCLCAAKAAANCAWSCLRLHPVYRLSGRDAGDGLGKTIRYQDFVIAVDTVGSRHPLKINSGRFFTDLKARYLKDTEGRRLCTPGGSPPAGLTCGQGLHEGEN